MSEHQLFLIPEDGPSMDLIWEHIGTGVAEFEWIPGWEQVINNREQISVFAVVTYHYTKKDLIKICQEIGKIIIILTADELLHHAICKPGMPNGINRKTVKDFIKSTAPIEFNEENLNVLLDKVSKYGLMELSYREYCALYRFSEIL